MKSSNIKNLSLCGLFAALTVILSQISLPIGPVPINLALFSVFLASGLLYEKWGALSQTVYVALGAFGLPVFANFNRGISALFGPTGGYIFGYILAVFITGLIIRKNKKTIPMFIVAMLCGLAACYILGTAWFVYVTKIAFLKALMLCVIPFLLGDFLKIAIAAVMVKKLSNIIFKEKR